MRVRLVTLLYVAPMALAAVIAWAAPSLAASTGASCGQELVKNEKGTEIKVLFAKNGSVQRYVILGSRENMEEANDLLMSLQQRYGPAGLDAPPMRIVSFKKVSGGMMVPDKAVDSCGRTLSFQ